MQAEQSSDNEAVTESRSAEGFINGLADKLGATARAATIFGAPVDRDGVTVIPVGKARWGFGGGAGKRRDEDGAGGGGGVQVIPVGFIELRDGRAEFRPIRNLSFGWLILGGLAGLLLLRRALRPTTDN
jgi:uncharacterized spore protein YtfJ